MSTFRSLGLALALLAGTVACGSSDEDRAVAATTSTTSTSTTTTTTTTLDVAAAIEDELVNLYETRGLEPDEAEAAAAEALDNGLSAETVDALKEFADRFVENRQEIPVYGPYLSEDEALCIVTEMMVAMGFGATIDFIGDIWLPMSVEDAHAVVDPVATCADLVEKVWMQGNAYGIGNVDCFTDGLTEADVVRFEVLRLTGPRENYFDVDIMERCIPGYDD
ncbi:MAG TPA: hypothetical protein QGI23_00305 [Acidimicrobiales bacterium]|nr:hypothetical protein [Acidimicrobiales bacterium]